MRDFTLDLYTELLRSLQRQNYDFQTLYQFITNPSHKSIIIRHDVDKKPENSLKTAIIENELGIKGSYYFRTKPCSFNSEIILQIKNLGHEIGYHYESMDTQKGDIDKAYDDFKSNLAIINNISEVKTICMHGSPKSKHDNRLIWSKYDYKSLGILAEPYLDIDFNTVFYLTDTGRMWNGWKYSVRDKISEQQIWINRGFNFHKTYDIIERVNNNHFPNQVMINIHPQRWTNSYYHWIKENVLQRIKNAAKHLILITVK